MPDKRKSPDREDPRESQPGRRGDTKEKPAPEGPKKEPPIDPPNDPPKNGKGDGKEDGKGDGKGDAKQEPKGPKGDINIQVNINGNGGDNGIKIGKWVKVDDPRDQKKAKKRVAWKRTQIHRTTSGKVWFIEEVVSDNGEILEVSVTPVNPPNPDRVPGSPFKSLTKTRDALALTDKDGKVHKYDAEKDKYYPPK